MTAFAFGLADLRWGGQQLLSGSIVDLAAGAQSHDGSLPQSMGDVYVVEAQILVTGITTLDITAQGVLFGIRDAPGTFHDILGVSQWFQVSEGAAAIQAAAYVSPDPLVLWRQGEVLHVRFANPEGSATTADMTVWVKVLQIPEGVGPPSTEVFLTS